MKRINIVFAILICLYSSFTQAADTLQIKEKLIAEFERQIELHLNNTKRKVCNISLANFANRFLPEDCPSTEYVEQMKSSAINANCYFYSFSSMPKSLDDNNTGNEDIGIGDFFITDGGSNLFPDMIQEKMEDLNDLEYVKKYSEVHLVLVTEIPVSLVFYLGDYNDFGDVYLKMSNQGARGILKPADEDAIIKAQATIKSLISRAIDNVKRRVQNQAGGAERVKKLVFYTFETINKKLYGDDYNTEQHCYYQFDVRLDPVNLFGDPQNKVSFKEIFERCKNEAYQKAGFSIKKFDARIWLARAVPELLSETYKAYDRTKTSAVLLGNWQVYEDLINYLLSPSTVRFNSGNFQGPGYLDFTNGDINTRYFGQSTLGQRYLAWQNLEDLPVEAFKLVGKEKAVKILNIVAGYLKINVANTDIEINSGYQRTIVNTFKYFASASGADKEYFLSALRNKNPINNHQALIYDVYNRVTDFDDEWVSAPGREKLEVMIQLSKILGGSSYESTFKAKFSNISDPANLAYQKSHGFLYATSNTDNLYNAKVGTSEIEDYEFNYNGKVKFNQKLLKSTYYECTENSPCYDCTDGCDFRGEFEIIPFPEADALELIDFTNATTFTFGFESIDNFNWENKRGGFTVPALVLDYCKTKIGNINRIAGYRIGLDLLCIATIPFTGGWSAVGIGGRLAIISSYAMALSGGADLISMAGGDQIPWLKELRDVAGEISLYTMGGSILAGSANLLQNGLVKLTQRLEANNLNGLAVKIRKFHNNISKNFVELENLLGNGTTAQKAYLNRLISMDKECQQILGKLGNMQAELEATGNFAGKLSENTWIKVETNGGVTSYKMATQSSGQITQVVGTDVGGKVKLSVSMEEVPANTDLIRIINHKVPETHISKAGFETSESIILGQRSNGTTFICEGKLINGKRFGNCFTRGTPVTTEKGRTPIEFIKESDLVGSYNEARKEYVWARVTALSQRTVKKLVQVITGNNDTIWATPEHLFMTAKNTWLAARNLSSKTKLLALAGVLVSVQSVQEYDSIAVVYNFEVAGTHTYAVGYSGLIVHNECGEVFEVGFNVLKKDPEFATTLRPAIEGIDQALLQAGATEANTFMGLGFLAIDKAAQLKSILKNTNFINYAKGLTTADFSWLKDYNYLKGYIAGKSLDEAGKIAQFFIEARAYKLPTGMRAEYDVSKYSPAELKELYYYATGGFEYMPSVRTAENIILFFGKQSPNGSVSFVNNLTRRMRLANLGVENLNILKKRLSLGQIDIYSLENLKNFIYNVGHVGSIFEDIPTRKVEYTNPNGKVLKWSLQDPIGIDNSIKTKISSSDPGKNAEGIAGSYVKNKKDIIGFGKTISRLNKTEAGEFDIETYNEIIEVKNTISDVTNEQFTKFIQTNHLDFLNPFNKTIILYIHTPFGTLSPNQISLLDNLRANGVIIVNSLTELGAALK